MATDIIFPSGKASGPIMKPFRIALLLAMVLPWVGSPVASFAAGPRSLAPTAAADSNYTAGKAAVDAGDYEAAVVLLGKAVAEDPRHADALNYLGYSHRQLGNLDQALNWYQKALAVNPDHRGAIEYLGELYLQMNQPAQAEEQLAKLSRLCFFGCEEYDDLNQAIADYHAGRRPDG
jgi:tetratricopeptide (TPR) repeat protein